MGDSQYLVGLTLNKGERDYYARLMSHLWLYPLCDSRTQYLRAKRAEERLKRIAQERKGNYQILWQRVSEGERQLHKLNGNRHRMLRCY